MANFMDQDTAARLATEILIAYLPQKAVEPSELPSLVRELCSALVEGSQGVRHSAEATPLQAVASTSEAQASRRAFAQREKAVSGAGERETPLRPQPAVPVEESVTRDYLISLEDGKPYRTLRRHLMSRYGLTPDEYRKKWGLPADYPMTAPNYSEQRADVAKRSGLGHSKTGPGRRSSAKPAPAVQRRGRGG